MLFKRIIKQTLYDVVPETATKVLENSVTTSWCEITIFRINKKYVVVFVF